MADSLQTYRYVPSLSRLYQPDTRQNKPKRRVRTHASTPKQTETMARKLEHKHRAGAGARVRERERESGATEDGEEKEGCCVFFFLSKKETFLALEMIKGDSFSKWTGNGCSGTNSSDCFVIITQVALITLVLDSFLDRRGHSHTCIIVMY